MAPVVAAWLATATSGLMKTRNQRKHGLFSFWPDNSTDYFADAATPKTVILFRHLEKTGGVSLRSSFQASACQFFGYQLYATTMNRIERFVHNFSHYKTIPHAPWEHRNPHSNTTACVEAHSPTPDLGELMQFAALLRRSCTVVPLLLVRRPDEHFISFFRWTHRPERNETAASYAAKLLEWSPRDLQTNILWQPHRALVATRRLRGNPFSDLHPQLDCERVMADASAFHVLDLTRKGPDAFGATMRRLRSLTRLELPPFHDVPRPRYMRPSPPALSLASILQDTGVNYTRRVWRHAPCDWRLYDLSLREPTEAPPEEGMREAPGGGGGGRPRSDEDVRVRLTW